MGDPFTILGIRAVQAAGVIEDATPVAEIIANGLSLILSLSGALAMLSFALSGVLYVSAGGDEKKMKQAKAGMMFSIAGTLVCICSLIIVRTVVSMV